MFFEGSAIPRSSNFKGSDVFPREKQCFLRARLFQDRRILRVLSFFLGKNSVFSGFGDSKSLEF